MEQQVRWALCYVRDISRHFQYDRAPRSCGERGRARVLCAWTQGVESQHRRESFKFS